MFSAISTDFRILYAILNLKLDRCSSTICAFILQVQNLPVMQLQNVKGNFHSQEKGPKTKLRLQ